MSFVCNSLTILGRLGDNCFSNKDCYLEGLLNGRCGSSKKCICPTAYYSNKDKTKCLPTQLGSPCRANHDCQVVIDFSSVIHSKEYHKKEIDCYKRLYKQNLNR